MESSTLLIIKTGGTMRPLARKAGDFEDWIIRNLGRDISVQVTDAEHKSLPNSVEWKGVLITGSHSMVTNGSPWIQHTAAWIAEAVQSGTALLGICFGHQILAAAMGGTVAANPLGKEYGTVPVHLTGNGATDPLFRGLPSPFPAHVGHSQSVNRLPETACRLAFSEKDPIQAFRIGCRAWGVQFHPEFDERITAAYIERHKHELVREGQDIETIVRSVRPAPHARSILSRFVRFCFKGPDTCLIEDCRHSWNESI